MNNVLIVYIYILYIWRLIEVIIQLGILGLGEEKFDETGV